MIGARRATRRLAGHAAAIAVGVLVLALGLPAGAQARTSCAYAGAPTNVLTVRVQDGVGEIRRRGLEITAGESGRSPRPCAGGTPTVLNTDTIRLVLVGLDFADLDLGGGPFAPGATPETEGASEIEIQVTGRDGVTDIIGTPAGDEFHWGAGGANPGLNLNPRDAGDRDVDVTVTGRRDQSGPLIANGEGGDDTIVASPGAVVRGIVTANGGRGNDVLSSPRSTGGVLDGGPGDDVITGGALGDLRLDGDTGDDRVDGGGGADTIIGGRGRDRLSGGAGPDTIRSRDFARDTVSCGASRDRLTADRRDRARGCETIRRR